MMRIKLINCDANLKLNFGIDMQDIGAYDRLCLEINKKVVYSGVEYDFPPADYMLIDVEDDTEIPDLSEFGEVESIDTITW